MSGTYDVLAINIESGKVRFMAQGKDGANAEAIMNMAIMRRGVGEDVYSLTTAGSYKEGEVWEGPR